MPPIARGQTWLFQPLPMSTVPNTGRNQSDSGYRGLDEEEDWSVEAVVAIFKMADMNFQCPISRRIMETET